jgi:diaminopimelate epimerase
MKVKFLKISAAGNDFVMIDNRGGRICQSDCQKLARKLCDRKYAIGADGLILLEKSESYDFKMKYFNSDGSFASMCGNGGRAISKFAFVSGVADKKMSFETDAGIISSEILDDDQVKLSLYPPKDLRMDIKLKAGDKEFSVDFINTGVPHAVIFVDNIENIGVFKYGKIIRNHAEFAPDGTNVDFVKVDRSSNSLYVRTFERGVEDETLACGTGIIASGIISVLKKFSTSPTKIIARGGDRLLVSLKYDRKGDECKIRDVILEGPAIIAFTGEVEI